MCWEHLEAQLGCEIMVTRAVGLLDSTLCLPSRDARYLLDPTHNISLVYKSVSKKEILDTTSNAEVLMMDSSLDKLFTPRRNYFNVKAHINR